MFTERVQWEEMNKRLEPGLGKAGELRILRAAAAALRRTTGIAAVIGRDGTIEVPAGRRTYRFRAKVKSVDRFAIPASIKAEGEKRGERTLLAAPFITREVAEGCRRLHVPFLDTAGNAYLEGPGLLVYVVGQPRPAGRGARDFRAVKPAGLRIVFALLCRPALVEGTYREIAAQAGVALGTVGPVMKDLEARGYVRFREGVGGRLLEPARLIEEWVTHYPAALRAKLNPRRFRADVERLRQMDLAGLKACWGGEPAAAKLTGYLKPAQYTIYAREPVAKLVAAARMRADEAGNVEVLDRFWNFEADEAFPDVAPPLVVYADLLATHEGRDAEAARMIYEQRIAPGFREAD
jgi:hypothetical protein